MILDLSQGQARVSLDQSVEASLAWAGALEPVWVLLPLISHRMAGEADVALQLTGTLGAPVVDGHVRLADGSYENLDLGTLLSDLQIEMVADTASRVTLSLSGNDGDNGILSGQGLLVREDDNTINGDLSLSVESVHLVRRDDVKLKGSGTLTYELTPDRDRLSGDIAVESAQISLNATYADPIPTLNVVDPNATSTVMGSQRAGKETDLAIRVTAPPELQVIGRGLTSEWAADLAVGGTLALPTLSGSLDLSRGEFSFLGETFPLTNGQALFTGGGDVDPELSVVAARTTAGITAKVELSGRASAPAIRLTSEPVLPEDEVLARILFGKSAGQLGPLEAVQLANAATELTGLAGRGGVVGSLRRSVGLDVFRFGSNVDGNTIVVGERLSKNIFVGVEQGLEGQGSEVVIEWQLSDDIALNSTLKQNAGSDIGLQWSRDY